MNISYSYYDRESDDNNYSIDPQDNLYNLAVAINNNNAQDVNNTGFSAPYKLSKPSYNRIRNDLLFKSPYPFFNVQGEYFNSQVEDYDTINNSILDRESDHLHDNDSYINDFQKIKYKHQRHKIKHIDDNSSEELSEEKLDHVKECNYCKKIFLDIIKERKKKHVFNKSNITDPLSPLFSSINIPSQIQQIQQLQQLQQLHQMKLNDQYNSIVNDTNRTNIDRVVPIVENNKEATSTIFSKEIILVVLIGVAIILVLDILTGKRR